MYQYMIPMATPKSSSTKDLTNSTMAFGIGQRMIISAIPSMTAVATTPTTATAMRDPTGPDMARDLLLPRKKPMPMTPPIAMNWAMSTREITGLDGCLELTKICHPLSLRLRTWLALCIVPTRRYLTRGSPVYFVPAMPSRRIQRCMNSGSVAAMCK